MGYINMAHHMSTGVYSVFDTEELGLFKRIINRIGVYSIVFLELALVIWNLHVLFNINSPLPMKIILATLTVFMIATTIFYSMTIIPIRNKQILRNFEREAMKQGVIRDIITNKASTSI